MTTFLLSSSISSTINRIPYTIKSHIVHPLNNSSLCLKTRSSSSSSSSCHTRTKTIKAVLSQQYSKIGAQTIGPIPSDQLLQSVEIAAKTGAQVVMEAVNKPRNISYKGLTDLVTERRKMLYVKENDEDSGEVSNDSGSFDAMLSTASVDAEATEKPKVNPTKPVTSDYHVAKKDEAVNDKEGDPMSPPKLIEDGKKERKKVKGVRSWVPFGCCSSVNVVN
ncbi:hypothetical protein Tco_0924580 [Tanacetum coccineum]|uniref:Uncharacterized protein n=1 Tax=Tanacetum coccineum TaxID=301880 RepID=A0ABQ5D4B3_9ASTR